MAMKHAVVTGAGFGGLAAALRLRARGLRVTVLDRLESGGGRARLLTRDGYHYDAGPTVLTAPNLFEELFALFGERLADHVMLLPVAPWYRMMFADGTHLDYDGDLDRLRTQIAAFSPQDAARYDDFLAHSQRLFKRGYEQYGTQPFHTAGAMLAALPHLIALRADRSVYAHTARYFSDDRLRRAFSIQPLLVGGNPFETTSIYSLIHFLERQWGVWFPRGGMAALVTALVALGERHGIEFRWNTTVERINVSNGNVTGVQTEAGETIPADLVVTNADPVHVYGKLIDQSAQKKWTAPRRSRLKLSMGLFVYYFTAKRTYPDVKHHTIVFGETYREILHQIFDGGTLPRDLSVYLHRPTATDPGCAPAGHDSFYALVPVPNLQSQIDWKHAGPAMRDALLNCLESRVLPGIRNEIVHEFYLTPEYFRDTLLSPAGAGFSIRPTLMQSAGFRFHNQSEDIAGLYLVGAGTHPGAGVPGVVSSAKVVERLLFGSVQ